MPRTFPAFLVEAREREERDKRGTEGGGDGELQKNTGISGK